MGGCGTIASHAENPFRLNASLARDFFRSRNLPAQKSTSEAWKGIDQPRLLLPVVILVSDAEGRMPNSRYVSLSVAVPSRTVNVKRSLPPASFSFPNNETNTNPEPYVFRRNVAKEPKPIRVNCVHAIQC